MRAARLLIGLSLFALAGVARSQTAPAPVAGPTVKTAVIAVPETEVRSGPSPMFYATSKLRKDERVEVVVEDVPGDYLKIRPPSGSFSWINARFIEVNSDKLSARVESIADAPVRIGSALTDIEPTVEQVKLQRGTQLVLIGPVQSQPDGSQWWRIVPPPQEVRYVLKQAVDMTKTVETMVSSATPPAPPPIVAAPAAALPTDALFVQAEEAERAGNVPLAMQLYDQQARQTTNHDLQVRCYSRMQYLHDNPHVAAPGAVTPIPSAVSGSQVAGQPVVYSPPPMQSSGPGILQRRLLRRWPTGLRPDRQRRPVADVRHRSAGPEPRPVRQSRGRIARDGHFAR